MQTIATLGGSRRVLADLVHGGLVRDIALVVGSAVFVGITAQVAIPLPVTPVPITLQTFAVLLSGAALGPMRAAAGMLLYLGVGAAGVPWFSAQNSGWAFPTFGYIIGFVLAATLVGALARRGLDRSVPGTIGLMALGNLVIYAVGVPYLAVALGRPLVEAIGLGMTPFLIGDGLKILLAAGLLPAAWRLAGERPRSD
jgi:biotin transport system substrate-specific component